MGSAGSLQFLARDSVYAIARYMLSPVGPSVRPSFTRMDQSKTVEVRIMQLYHRVAHYSSFLVVNFTAKFQREHIAGAPNERGVGKIGSFRPISRRIS